MVSFLEELWAKVQTDLSRANYPAAAVATAAMWQSSGTDATTFRKCHKKIDHKRRADRRHMRVQVSKNKLDQTRMFFDSIIAHRGNSLKPIYGKYLQRGLI